MFGIGAGEFIVILIVGLIVFGPGKLPEVGRGLGKALREFRKAQAALSQTLNEVDLNEKKSPPAEKSAEIKKSVTADDVINLAKESPIVKENHNEESFNTTADNVVVDDARAGVAGARGSSNGVDKQS